MKFYNTYQQLEQQLEHAAVSVYHIHHNDYVIHGLVTRFHKSEILEFRIIHLVLCHQL